MSGTQLAVSGTQLPVDGTQLPVSSIQLVVGDAEVDGGALGLGAASVFAHGVRGAGHCGGIRMELGLTGPPVASKLPASRPIWGRCGAVSAEHRSTTTTERQPRTTR